MIVGTDFVWMHMPKTAGQATRKFLRQSLKGVKTVSFATQFPGSNTQPAHHSLAQRQAVDPNFRFEDKRIMCGIRRLPKWLLSNIHYLVSEGQDQEICRENLLRGEFRKGRPGKWVSADQRLTSFEVDKVEYWIRQEHLSSDLFKAFEGLEVEDLVTQKGEVPRKNKTKVEYIKRLDFWFTKAELKQLYEANPVWAEVEERAYGNILT